MGERPLGAGFAETWQLLPSEVLVGNLAWHQIASNGAVTVSLKRSANVQRKTTVLRCRYFPHAAMYLARLLPC